MKRAASNAKANIENAASEAVKVIAHAAEEATKTLANAATEALKVTNANANAGDHDLLTEFRAETKVRMEDLKNAIQQLTDGIAITLKDHETRLRSLEQNRWLIAGGIAVLVVLIGYGVGFALKIIH